MMTTLASHRFGMEVSEYNRRNLVHGGEMRNRKQKNPALWAGFFCESGAGNEIRTRDPNLGKVVLYQLSYSRSAFRGFASSTAAYSTDYAAFVNSFFTTLCFYCQSEQITHKLVRICPLHRPHWLQSPRSGRWCRNSGR